MAIIQDNSIIKHNQLWIDTRCRLVKLGKEEIIFSPKEFETLKMLAMHPGWVYTKEQIYEAIYKEEIENINNIIYCLIYGIRKKLKGSCDWKYVQTVKGIGYKFVIPKE